MTKRFLLALFPLRATIIVALIFTSLFLTSSAALSQDGDDDELKRKREEIEQLQKDLEEVQGKKQTLSSTINYLDGKIKLTQAQIQQTQNQVSRLTSQVEDLNVRIEDLDLSLQDTTDLLIHRIGSTYKRSRTNSIISLFTNRNLSQLISHYKYLQTSQKHDRDIIFQLESSRANFQQEKSQKQKKQVELKNLNDQYEAQQQVLGTQQQEKQHLLQITKNDENRFQAELAKKLAELEAIQSIIAGQGDETEVGSIDQGSRIATIIAGPSTCSSGGHLHLEIAQNEGHKNPADYLSNKSVTWDNSPDGPFDFRGSWPWPINDPIRITQGYGMTFYASTLKYYGGAPHTGIDMVNTSDYTVKAIQNGTLYRGSIACRGGSLRYVRVKHQDDFNTYYLHVNY